MLHIECRTIHAFRFLTLTCRLSIITHLLAPSSTIMILVMHDFVDIPILYVAKSACCFA